MKPQCLTHVNERHHNLQVCPNFWLALCYSAVVGTSGLNAQSVVVLSSGTSPILPLPWLCSMLTFIYPALVSRLPPTLLLAKACHPPLSLRHSPPPLCVLKRNTDFPCHSLLQVLVVGLDLVGWGLGGLLLPSPPPVSPQEAVWVQVHT